MSDRHEREEAELKRLYEAARVANPAAALRMATKATTQEERRFYAAVAEMNQQRTQKEVIKKNLF